MSNEITVSVSLSVNKASAMATAVTRAIAATKFDMTGTVYETGTLAVTNSAVAIPLGSVATPHWAYLKNLDATSSVRIRNGASGADVIRLYPGEFGIIPLDDASTPYAITPSGTANLEYAIFAK